MNWEQEVIACMEMSREAGYEWAEDNGVCVEGVWRYEVRENFYEKHIVFSRGYGDACQFWLGVIDYVSEKQDADFKLELREDMVTIYDSEISAEAINVSDERPLWD